MHGGCFSLPVTLWLAVTTLCLQVLANLANEWGDWHKGTDCRQTGREALGLQSGRLSERTIIRAIGVTAVMAAGAGLFLLWTSFGSLRETGFWVFLALGVVSLAAAIYYTIGRRPYGYRGLGDLAVFFFFGWVGVCGSEYLLTHRMDWGGLLPASAIGFLITAVLNVNNIRDIDNDRRSGKITFAVWWCTRFAQCAERPAKWYQTCLVAAAYACAAVFACLRQDFLYFLLSLPVAAVHLYLLWKSKGAAVDRSFKWMVACTFLFALSYLF